MNASITRTPEPHDPEALTDCFAIWRSTWTLSPTSSSTQRESAPAGCEEGSPHPLRQTLLDALADLGYPTDSRTLRAFVSARYGVAIPTRQFGTLAVQERAIFSRGGITARPVWLGSGLTLEGFHPVKRIWGRSDWPDAWRIITPHSSRIQQLHVTEALCRLAEHAEQEAQDAAALRAMALRHTKNLPGMRVDELEPDFAQYADLANLLLRKFEPEERHIQEEAAVALAALPERVRLFGAEDRDLATVPTTRVKAADAVNAGQLERECGKGMQRTAGAQTESRSPRGGTSSSTGGVFVTTRRNAFAVIAGALGGLARRVSSAQTQEVVNGLQIVSTGDVHVGQHAAGTQQIYVDSQGNTYYARSGATHIVENDGQIVATGDIWVEQEAVGSQVTIQPGIHTSP